MLCSSHSQFLYDKYHEPHRHRSLSERWSFNHQEIIMCDKIIKLANLKIKGRIEQQTRVYSTKGISPTLNSAMGHGGNCIPLFLIMITGGKRMKSLLLSWKVKPDVGGQVLDIYNQAVMQGISPTIKTTIDTANMTFVTIMNKEIIHTAPNGKRYSIQIRKYTPRDCFRLMGLHEADIDKLLSKEKTGQLIISKSKLYALAGNSIVTNCLTAMFEELIFPSGNHYHDKTGQLSLF